MVGFKLKFTFRTFIILCIYKGIEWCQKKTSNNLINIKNCRRQEKNVGESLWE